MGMGKDLYETYPASREIFDKADEILGFSLTKLCFEGPAEKLSSTANSQPAILAASIACLKAIEESFPELKPSAALGLSLGEYSALVAANSLEFSDAIRLVYSRGRFMEEASKQNPGKMASLLGISDVMVVEEICKVSGAEIANLNCPGQIVISGKTEAVKKAADLAVQKGAKRSVELNVSGPFHSSLMKEASLKLKRTLADVKFAAPSMPVISNVDAEEENSEDRIKENLVNQVNRTTYWEQSIRNSAKYGIDTFLEIGPGKVLKGLLRRIDPGLTVYNAGTTKDIEGLKNVVKG